MLLIVNEFEQINYLLIPVKFSENLGLSDNFRWVPKRSDLVGKNIQNLTSILSLYVFILVYIKRVIGRCIDRYIDN